MTAIAYRDRVMAADTTTMGGDMVRGHSGKIARSPVGTLGAAAGIAGVCERFRQWVRAGKIDEWLAGGCAWPLDLGSPKENGFGAIIVRASGAVTCVDYLGNAVRFEAPFYVEGSAEQILLGALAAGASAEEAVRIAIRYDTGCGGEVQVERL